MLTCCKVLVSAAVVFMLSLSAGAAGPTKAGRLMLVAADIPTKSCSTAGMAEDQPPPVLEPTIKMQVPPADVGRIVYYRAAWAKGVVGPSGWTCAARSGSDGIALMVGPRGTVFDGDSPVIGPIIVLRLIDGGTSGRFAVAGVVARVFPGSAAFAKRVKAEQADTGQITFRPYAPGEVTRVGERMVVFRTPAGQKGLGTVGDLAPGSLPIGGFASLSGSRDAPQLTLLTVRLPPNEEDLSQIIVAEGMEGEASASRENP